MSTFLNISKNSATATNLTKNVSTVSNVAKTLVDQFLLKEDGFYLLLETGGKIILEQSTASSMSFTNLAKS
jgi:hypothetical protein